jgi:hypothetical protein
MGTKTTSASKRWTMKSAAVARSEDAVDRLGRGAAPLADREGDQAPVAAQALLVERRPGQRVGLEQERRVGGHRDAVLDADLLEQPPRRGLADGDQVHRVERLGHRLAVVRALQRPRPDRVGGGGHAGPTRDPGHVQVALDLVVVEDAAAAEQEQVELLDLGQHLLARRRARRHHVLDVVMLGRVGGVAGEHDDPRPRHRGPQLAHGHGQDRLVAGVQPAVGPGQPDPRLALDVHARGSRTTRCTGNRDLGPGRPRASVARWG